MSKTMPDEAIDVIDKMGKKKSVSLHDVSEMLYDPRKIIEFNLIDNISRWARDRMAA
jgi:ATP-dependent Clp protease ATP-binding subunit ClpA